MRKWEENKVIERPLSLAALQAYANLSANSPSSPVKQYQVYNELLLDCHLRPFSTFQDKCLRQEKFQKELNSIQVTPSDPSWPIKCVTGRPQEEQRKVAALVELIRQVTVYNNQCLS